MELLAGIPDEVFTTEILAKRMDLKTLAKCSCVSRWWYKTLNSQEFIDTRRRHHSNSTHLLFVEEYYNNSQDAIYNNARVRFSTGDADLHKIEYNVGDYEFLRRAFPVHRDLVCVVCNPWTGQTIKLPRLEVFTLHYDDVVFGYLDSLRKYVVLEVVQEWGQSKVVVNKVSFNHVNDSSSEWKWETIKEACPYMVRRGVFVDNFVYWIISHTRRNNNKLIVSLDVEKEKFGITNHPLDPNLISDYNVTLIDLNGTLYLTDQDNMKESQVLKIWALKRELGQWEKKYNVELDNIGLPALSLEPKSSMEGELILNLMQRGTWCICDPNTGKFRTITAPNHRLAN